jgi:hypothetical protein
LGIEDKILFTGNEVKKDFFFAYGFDLIFDDDSEWHCNPNATVYGKLKEQFLN